MATKISSRIWSLAFVPNYRYGRWNAAATIAAIGIGPFWPFDVPAVTRFFAYAIIVPLTWAGVALNEILVNTILS